MKINIIGRQMNVYEEMKLLIEKKLAKFEKFFPSEGEATATLSCKHNRKFIEITIAAAGTLFRSEVGAESFRDALDDAVTNIERQIRKNKTKLEKRLRTDAFEREIHIIPEEPEDEFKIVRNKRFSIDPMSVEEAILQMNMLGHDFFVYRNVASNEINVVYKRKGGAYGKRKIHSLAGGYHLYRRKNP